MAIRDDRVSDLCDKYCNTPSLGEYWFTILTKYKELGFTDTIEDRIRIEEYSYVLQEIRKYISKSETKLRESITVEALCKTLEDMIEKAKEFSNERRKLVYTMLRDDWIIMFLEEAMSYENENDITMQDWR